MFLSNWFSKKTLAVEFDFPKLRIAEVQPGNPIKLRQFGELDYSFFGTEELLRILKRKFSARNVVITAPLNSATHQIESFPLEEQELRRIVPAEARKIAMLEADDLVFDYQVIGENREQAVRRLEVLIVTASRRELRDRVALFQEGGFNVKAATTIPIALINLFRLQPEQWGDDAFLAVHIGLKATNILVVQRGKLLFSMEAALDLQDFVGNEISYAPRLFAEIKRAFIYFNQRFRGSQIQRIVVSGQGNLRELTGPLIQSFAVEVELLKLEGLLDLSELKADEGTEEIQHRLPSLAAVIGAVCGAPSSLTINLSKDLKAAGKPGAAPARLQLGRAPLIAGLLLLVAIGAGYFYFDISASSVRATVDQLAGQVSALRNRIDQARAEVEAGQQQVRRAALLQSMVSAGPLVAATLKSMSLAVGDNTKFTAIQIRPLGPKWEITVQGSVQANNAHIASLEFGYFIQALKLNPLILERSHRKPPETVPAVGAGTNGNLAPTALSETAGTQLNFDLRLVVGQ